MTTSQQLRVQFLNNVMELYKHKSSLISSNCGHNALKLQKDNQNMIDNNRICMECGQILIFGKTKRIRFKTKTRNRQFTISTLSRLINKRKRKKILNYKIETCLNCNYSKYDQSSFTSLKYLKKQRLKKLAKTQQKKKMIKIKKENNHSSLMKKHQQNIGLKTIKTFENIRKMKKNKRDGNDRNNDKNEMSRLLNLIS